MRTSIQTGNSTYGKPLKVRWLGAFVHMFLHLLMQLLSDATNQPFKNSMVTRTQHPSVPRNANIQAFLPRKKNVAINCSNFFLYLIHE